MASAENASEKGSLTESIVPTQQIAYLENGRKDKINIPHRPRVKKSIIMHQNDGVMLNRSGRCVLSKSANSLPTKPVELRSSLIKKNMTCVKCKVPVIQTDSGKIKPYNDIPKATCHGDDNITNIYRKPMFYNKTIHNEGGDAIFGSFKTSNINRWVKSNWSKLTKATMKNQDVEILKKYAEGSQNEIIPGNTEVVCNMMRQVDAKGFPFVITEIGMPNYITDSDDSNVAKRCCGDRCACCRLACRMFGCRCQNKKSYPPGRRRSAYPYATINLNQLERAHLQKLYDTPCSSIQFSTCNCAVQDAMVKQHTTAAHYFAHKGLRQLDACAHHGSRSGMRGSSCDGSEVTWRSQKSYVAYSVKSGIRQDYAYAEDDDCCCKCCDMAMVSTDCQTDSLLYLGHIVQTEPQRKRCRPCCKCCKCNRNGGRCSNSCKHFQLNAEGGTKPTTTNKADSTKGATFNKGRSSSCCNKCTGIPNRIRGGANNVEGSCVSCKHRLNAGTNNNDLFGQVIPGNEERFNIGFQESWLSRKNIAKLFGIDKRKKDFASLRYSGKPVCNNCNFDLSRQPQIPRRFNRKIDKRQLHRMLAMKNLQLQQQMMMLQQQQQQTQQQPGNFDEPQNFNDNPQINYDFLTNRNFNPHINKPQYNCPLNNRNFEIIDHNMNLSARKKHAHKHNRHHHNSTHAHHQQKTRIYKTHSTQCVAATQDQGTSCLADFKQAAEFGYKLNVLPPFKIDKYRRLFNEASGMFKSPITGREYNLKVEKVDYKTGLVKSELPILLGTYDKLPTFISSLSECKENNDKVMDAICDAILMTKDMGGAGEIGGYKSNDSSNTNTSNTIESITDNDLKLPGYFNEPLVYRTKTLTAYSKIFREEESKITDDSADMVDLFIQSNPVNNIFTNKNISQKNSPLKSAIFRPKNRLKTTSSTSLMLGKLKNTKMSAAEFKSFIMNDNMCNRQSSIIQKSLLNTTSSTSLMFGKIKNTKMSAAEFKSFVMNDNLCNRRSMKNSSRVIEQFNLYQLNDEANNSDVITMNSMEDALEDVEAMPQCNVPNFLQENLSVFSNTISNTYSLLKILECNQNKLSNKSIDEQIENVINYSTFINDNS